MLSWEIPPYRPPTEAHSLLIRATRNCPWNRCEFCGMYGDSRLEIRTVEEVKNDISAAESVAGQLIQWAESSGKLDQIDLISRMNGIPWLNEGLVKNVFIGDSDSLVMKTEDFKEILLFLGRKFPHLERVTTYARGKTLFKKKVESLKTIRESGLTRLHVGLESGDDVILKDIKKGASSGEMISAGKKAKEAGFELSEYVMPGLGGRERWENHVRETARVLNGIDPHFIRLRTLNFAMGPDSVLSKKAAEGHFSPQSLEELVTEVRALIETLEVSSQFVASDFAQNYYIPDIDGKLPEDRDSMLNSLDTAMEWIRSRQTI